jgi:hypothetical protein
VSYHCSELHAPTEDKSDDVKDSFYDKLERVFDKLPEYYTKILLGDFNAKVGKEVTQCLMKGLNSVESIL